MKSKPKIGLALGSGAARGWAHIGIIRALAEIGIRPDIVCGTSVGSLVGASYVSGKLDKLERWVCSLSRMETVRFFEIKWSFNGFVNNDKFDAFMQKYVADSDEHIESMSQQFAAVSTDLETGREVWFTEGSMLQAVWASIALPGLFPAVRSHESWLVDGGLVNPVPVSVCRALGADLVIAVNLNGDIVGRHIERQDDKSTKNNLGSSISDFLREYTGSIFPMTEEHERPPGLFDAIAGSINITQDRITRSRMAGDPPDLMLSPKLANIGLLEFYRAQEAIDEGKNCVQCMLPEIRRVFDID
ncbi:MAG: patatin-like phospholipase RssA [Chromatiales bacterium]